MEKVELNSKRWLDIADLDEEQWATIDYPNYSISNYGRLKRMAHVYIPSLQKKHLHHRTLKERICKLYKNRCGYLCFRILDGNKTKQLYIHKLVAKYFVDNPYNYNAINHKDENKSNNYYLNLEYCTNKYNSNYGTCQERRAASVREMRRKREISIDQYTTDGEFVRHYSNKGEVEDAGFCLKTILRVCNHKSESSQGFVWRFGNEPYSKPVYIDSKGGTVRKKIYCYDLNGNFLWSYNNLLEAAIAIGGKNKRAGICECAYGKKEQAYGYIWKYANE